MLLFVYLYIYFQFVSLFLLPRQFFLTVGSTDPLVFTSYRHLVPSRATCRRCFFFLQFLRPICSHETDTAKTRKKSTAFILLRCFSVKESFRTATFLLNNSNTILISEVKRSKEEKKETHHLFFFTVLFQSFFFFLLFVTTHFKKKKRVYLSLYIYLAK